MMKNKSFRKMKRDLKAISPVVATLLLVLVAVAAAVAFYVFESGWQQQQTAKASNVDINSGAPYTIKVSGSTTIDPFMELAAQSYMDANSAATVQVSAVGSGAGIDTLAAGQADIAMVSRAWTSTDVAAHPNWQATVIGYDAVVMIVSSDAFTAHAGLNQTVMNNMNKTIAQELYSAPTASGHIATWGQLITALGGTSSDSTSIVTYDRSDSSGTEECFGMFFLGQSSGQIAAPYAADQGAQGNPGMISAVEGNANAIGFTSFGMADGQSALKMFGFNHIVPTKAAIVAEIKSTADPTGYDAVRPLTILTDGAPSTNVQNFISYLLQADINYNDMHTCYYLSLYDL